MEAYELAARIQTERENETYVPTFRMLAQLLDRAKPLWPQLQSRKFNQNEHGHIRFMSTDYKPGAVDDWFDEIKVIFVDAAGKRQELGSVDRVEGKEGEDDEGIAFAETGGQTRPITPDDEEWEAIVGSIENAINECS